MVDPVKTLIRPEQQIDVAGFFAEHDIPQAAKTLQQVLERQRVNVALRSREAERLAASFGGVSRRRPAGPTVEIFALEPTAAQLIVRSHQDEHTVTADGREVTVRIARPRGSRGPRRAGAGDVLRPHPRRAAGRAAAHAAGATGRYLGRFATVSDLHLGETGFGRAPRLRLSADPATAHPVVCLRAALGELRAWGAEGLIVKGDVSHDSRTHEYELAGQASGGPAAPALGHPRQP